MSSMNGTSVPKVIQVKYERPRGTSVREGQEHLREGVQWEFSATLDQNLEHGYPGFGGLLRRIGTDRWAARHYNNTDWAGSSLTREGAIQNLVPAVILSMREFKEKQAAELAEYNRRGKIRQELADLFPDGVRVGVTGQVDASLDVPLHFSLHIRGLSEADVRKLADLMQKGGNDGIPLTV
jgi:hypothetical protein